MLASVRWLNRYLAPADLSADQAEHVLTHVGFPIESRQDLPDGDVRLDVELTSNRGDCLCHTGLAREIAAATGRHLALPTIAPEPPRASGAPGAADLTSVENRLSTSGCPRFTARVIRGVKVGPSPAWLVQALESVGQRSINSIVDISNFVMLELGHPNHVFDLDRLSGKRLIVRHAHAGERFTALDGRAHELRDGEMVVADAQRAQGLAGIIGGMDARVTEQTRDVLLEVATWDPLAVRRAARRLDIRTDASHRFERYVDPRDLDAVSLRAARLIVEIAGGELVPGMIDQGAPLAPRTVISLRPERCRRLLGVSVNDAEIKALLTRLGVDVTGDPAGRDPTLRCTAPAHRPDLVREVDLIEEVARLKGLESFELAPSLGVDLSLAQPGEWASREKALSQIGRTLEGLGFFEAVTFSFLPEAHAELFLPPGMRLLKVDESRRGGEPYLRPSIIPSLLTCRRANQDASVRAEGGVRLFETASNFAEIDDGTAFARRTVETRTLALVADAPGGHDERQAALRLVRGAIERLARALGGPSVGVEVRPIPPLFPALEPGATAGVLINAQRAGYIGLLAPSCQARWGLESPVVIAELGLKELIGLYPPKAVASALPRFPAVERDLSLVVDEAVEWSRIESTIAALAPPRLESIEFVGVYRGKQAGPERKSVTLRMHFRDPERTLRREEVDPVITLILDACRHAFGAELRL